MSAPLFSFTPKTKTFSAPVDVPHYRHGTPTFEFVYVPPSELKDRMDEIGEMKAIDAVMAIACGWDVKNDDGETLPFTRDAVAAFLDALYCSGFIMSAWLQGLRGGGAAAKN